MNKKIWIFLIAASAIVLCVFLYLSPVFSVSFKPSDVHPDFPIPANSKKVEKPHAKSGWAFYEISPPLNGKHFARYLLEIKIRGWKQVDQMGRMHVFEKDGAVMQAVLYPDEVSLLLESR